MNLSISTPIILFPAISLILLAYTEKFMQLAGLARKLKKQYADDHDGSIAGQIANLRRRIYLIRNMQAFGTCSFFFCLTSIFLLFNNYPAVAWYTFWLSMVLLMVALYLSFKEIRMSSRALRIALSDLKD